MCIIDFEGRWLLDTAVVNGGETAVLISSLAITEKPVGITSNNYYYLIYYIHI